ncbi:MAG: DUF805 domain-containing protein [Tannerella sp.]|jgi:uncharacterized membrane protein YhaH (DUF805 family)|nr:DUF805 domain-containing protein [Tannerella sp.]
MEQPNVNPGMIGWWKKAVFNNYANFKGRARRAEFWNFALATLILFAVLFTLFIIGITAKINFLTNIIAILESLAALALIVPIFSVSVRRLHDINKSGWNYFVTFIPFVGSIILLVWFFTEGNRGANQYGEDPKNLMEPAVVSGLNN